LGQEGGTIALRRWYPRASGLVLAFAANEGAVTSLVLHFAACGCPTLVLMKSMHVSSGMAKPTLRCSPVHAPKEPKL